MIYQKSKVNTPSLLHVLITHLVQQIYRLHIVYKQTQYSTVIDHKYGFVRHEYGQVIQQLSDTANQQRAANTVDLRVIERVVLFLQVTQRIRLIRIEGGEREGNLLIKIYII